MSSSRGARLLWRKGRAMSRAVLMIGLLSSTLAWARPGDPPLPGSPEFATYVMAKVDDLYRGTQSRAVMEMRIKTAHWNRTLSMESWSLGKGYSLVRILAPKKERGTATLKAKNDLFLYLNKTGRTVKVTSGMLGGSWMGSHFTNDDLVRHSRLSEDYTIRLTSSGKAAGVDVHRFTLLAKPDAPVAWEKLIVTVRQSDLMPLSQEFFDESKNRVRLLEFSEHRLVSGRVLPMKMTMKLLDHPGEHTMVILKEIDFTPKLSKGFFSLQRLKSL